MTQVQEDVRPNCFYNEETIYFGLPSPEQLAAYNIVVCTCGAAGKSHNSPLPHLLFVVLHRSMLGLYCCRCHLWLDAPCGDSQPHWHDACCDIHHLAQCGLADVTHQLWHFPSHARLQIDSQQSGFLCRLIVLVT